MIQLTDAQHEELERANADVARVVDPVTKKNYVLIPAESFEQLRAALDDEEMLRGAYVLMDEVARKAGWDDPEWDSYNVYAKEKGQ